MESMSTVSAGVVKIWQFCPLPFADSGVFLVHLGVLEGGSGDWREVPLG